MTDEYTQDPTLKTWSYEFGRAQVTLRRLSESLIKVTYRDQVGYLGLVKDFDAGKPYGWSATGSGVSEDGVAYGMHYSTPESALSDLCRDYAQRSKERDSKRINPEERKEAARVVLGEFFDELPDWEDG